MVFINVYIYIYILVSILDALECKYQGLVILGTGDCAVGYVVTHSRPVGLFQVHTAYL